MEKENSVAKKGIKWIFSKKRLWLKILIGTLLACIVLMLICDRIVVANASGKVFSNIDELAPTEVGLLLGTTPTTRIRNRKNLFFIYRIEAAEKLYKAGKIKRILVSGDEHSLGGIDETKCMRDSLVAHGIPDSVIILDGKGARTINSIINANKKYGLREFTIISQRFHNERAIYLAEHLDLDLDKFQAYDARDPESMTFIITYAREYFARVKMFIDLLMEDNSNSTKSHS